MSIRPPEHLIAMYKAGIPIETINVFMQTESLLAMIELQDPSPDIKSEWKIPINCNVDNMKKIGLSQDIIEKFKARCNRMLSEKEKI